MVIGLTDYVDYWKERIRADLNEETAKLIEKFDSELAATDFAEKTRQNYLAVIHMFLKFVQKPIAEIIKDDMFAFLNNLKENDKKLSTRKLYNQKIASFFKWYSANYIKDEQSHIDLKVDFPKPTKEYELPEWSSKLPTMTEIDQMLAVCDHSRDSAIFAVLVESGARINEILRMRYGDVKVNDNYIRITLRPRKTKRDIPIVWGAKYLMRWVDQHPTKNPNDPLWPRKFRYKYKEKKFANIDYRGAYEIIKRLKERASIEREINLKLFRHLRATLLAKDPRIAPQIKKAFLGHSPHSNTFERVYTHFSQDDVVNEILASYGLKQQEEETIQHIPELKGETCPRCNTPIAKNDKYCFKCWFVLDQEEALKKEEEREKQSEIIQKQATELEALKHFTTELSELVTAQSKTIEEIQNAFKTP